MKRRYFRVILTKVDQQLQNLPWKSDVSITEPEKRLNFSSRDSAGCIAVGVEPLCSFSTVTDSHRSVIQVWKKLKCCFKFEYNGYVKLQNADNAKFCKQ